MDLKDHTSLQVGAPHCMSPYDFKGALSGLRQFLTTESPLTMMKNAFFDEEGKFIFKIYDVTTWITNNCNTHIDQYLKK